MSCSTNSRLSRLRVVDNGAKSTLTIDKLLKDRQIGLPHRSGHDDDLAHKLYSSIDQDEPDRNHPTCRNRPLGAGIFNLEFSLDG